MNISTSETGRAADNRPGFQRLIEDAMAGQFEAVLDFHTSRFARNTIEAKRYKKLLRSELGVEVISVTQPLGADVDDPAAFLAESVHEIFDEYYSVSLSFWTKMGLREKARQGLVTGSLRWGYVKGEDGVAMADVERAPIVHALFTIYATGRYSFRDLAEWLNERGHRTSRGNLFGADTVREMLGNLAYCGYVTARRSTSRDIAASTRRSSRRSCSRNPGRPSPHYLLRKIVRCERCGGRMHGQLSGKAKMPRYYCSNRAKRHTCDQPLAHADKVEEQVAEFVATFRPTAAMRDAILDRLAAPDAQDDEETKRRRRQLTERRKRLGELFEMGDLERTTYVAKRDQFDTELDSLAPGPTPDIDGARTVLEDFTMFWKTETNPEPRRDLLAQLFQRVWIDGQRVAAVKPTAAFAPLFTTRPTQKAQRRPRRAAV